VRVIRSPWRRAAGWSPEEAAAELHSRRVELIGQLRCRSEARGVPPAAQEEIVDDAITAVVMSPRGVANEHHLLGAFWLAVDHRCRRHREGRHFTRLGSRVRVEFDAAPEHTTGGVNPFDRLELRDRFARAADLMADLDPRERRVLAVMACYGVGPVPAARHLGLPLGEVRSAARSATAKLDRVAAIAAAGRMCHYRYGAITAHAAGEATATEATAARAHVSACVPCGRVYRKLRREMRGREFQRAAAAAFLPMPAASFAHAGGLGRLAAWFEQRTPSLPHGGGERAAEVLGGAGAVKAATVGAAVVVAGGALTSHIVHAVAGSHAPTHHRAIRREAPRTVGSSTDAREITVARAANTEPASKAKSAPVTPTPRRRRQGLRQGQPPPSRSVGYLALGGTSGGSSGSSSGSSSQSRATVASVNQPTSSSSGEASPQPGQSGGGTDLGYLGR
jgi:DNA-directed RNA polymerase specialized sigma24 family protein